MTRRESQSHPKSGLVVAAAGFSIAFWSVWPWMQRPNDPWRSVDAGEIDAQRLPVLVLGLAILAIGIAVYTAGSRLLLLALSTIAGFAVLAVTNHAIDEASEITAMNAEIVSEVGWALYGIEWAGLVVVIASIVGLRNVQLGATIAGFRYTDTADDAGHRWPTRARVVARWCALAVTLLVGAMVLVVSVGSLREAHLYRQRTGEGLKFAWVGLGLFVAHCLLGMVAYVAVRLRAISTGIRARRAAIVLAALIVGGLACGDVLFVWVEAHGDRCIGACS